MKIPVLKNSTGIFPFVRYEIQKTLEAVISNVVL